jgi:PAS domain S-box-containing protein/putative nucleotidyltransferase with HDIG domain
MFAIDPRGGQVINVNPAAERLTGYTRQELVGFDLSMVHPEAERARVRAEFLRVEQEPAQHPGFHIQCRDGRLLPVMTSSSKSAEMDGRPIVNYTYFDITEQVENEHRLSTQNWALSAYAAATLALGRARTAEGLLQEICEAVTRDSVYLLAWIGIAEDGPDKPVRIAAAAGPSLSYLDGVQVSWSAETQMGKGPTGTCIRTAKSQIMRDCDLEPAFRSWRERAKMSGIRSSMAIPIPGVDGLRAALTIYAAQPRAFEPAAIEVFEHIAEQIGHGLNALQQEKLLCAQRQHLAKMQADLTEALSAMVAPIVLAMEMRDPYTTGHQSRVAEIAVAIGREMGWPEERLQGLRVAAQVHDIGKISIPAEILTKPGKLNAAELGMIREHAEIGYTILRDIPFAWPIAEIVRQHHEKLDGSGYPRGLTADEILPEAKVLAVADIVEAMAFYRPYRQGIKLHRVLQEIEKQSGTQLDAEAVRICVEMFRDKHFTVPGWVRR